MQTQGTLQEANLASLLQTMQSERATGTLSLENGEANCSLYFLFGHLFHASDASRQGEEVVVDALTWANGNFHFDPRAKLPAEETIKSSPAELISLAEQRGPAVGAAAPVGAEASATAEASAPEASPWSVAPAGEPVTAAPAPEGGGWAAPAADPTDTAPSPDDAAYQTPVTDWNTPAAEATPPETATEMPSDPAAWAPQPVAAEAPASPTAEEAPAEAAAPDMGYSWNAQPAEPAAEAPAYTGWQAAESLPAEAAAEAPSWSAAPEPAPEPEPVAAAPAHVEAAASAPPSPAAEMYPLPAGKTTYEGLKAAFVDFPKLLRTLRADGHTGYVQLRDEGFSGTLVFHAGELVEALADAGSQVGQGEAAFQQFRHHMDAGTGHLDVVDLNADLVAAIGQLFTAPQMFNGLLGRFVDFDALIEHLEESKVTGSVVVIDSSEIGVILLSDGSVLGAYTESARTPDTKLSLVSALAKERSSRIEVRSGGSATTGIDVEAQLAKPL